MVDRPTANDRPTDRATSFDGLAELAEARRLTRVPPPVDQAGQDERPQTAAAAQGGSSGAGAAPFQFRLRTILLVMVAASFLFAGMQVIGPAWSAVLTWFLVLALVHVIANFWGTRVAPGATQQGLDDEGPDSHAPQHDRRERAASAAVGAVRLSENARPGWPMFVVTAAGALVGGTLGGVSLVLLCLDQAGYAGVLVGTVSAAIVGGFLGFLTSTFAQIALRAWNEAVCGAAPPPPGRPATNSAETQ
ncbi:MAG TPA: hypothetical protein VG125_07940 [Pirellulales bacterium]|jgi:hypothetical protein|nr:hypothetical protein [Pirellulales bacterium]